MASKQHPNLPQFNRYADSHKDPQGPGDSRPTATQTVHDEDMVDKLLGKTVLITGCSSGLGVDTAEALALTGAKVVVTARDMTKLKQVVDELVQKCPKRDFDQFELLYLDLESLESVRKGAAEFLKQNKQLNILIANAGVSVSSQLIECCYPFPPGVGGVAEGKTKDGFEAHFGINHLSHFLLFQLLEPTLLASSTPAFQSRVVVVSSMIHRISPVLTDDYNFQKTPYNPALGYASSKTANIWFANELERRYASKGVHALSLHPGGIMTNLGSKHSPEFLDMLKPILSDPNLPRTFKSASQGAATTVLAAIGREFEGKGGFYLDDCAVALEFDENDKVYDPGYVKWAYDEQGAKKLWEDSERFVG